MKNAGCTVRFFLQNRALEDTIGSHACSVEALACVWPIAFLSGVHSSYRYHHELCRNTLKGCRKKGNCRS
jgi:hypothetical protein